MSADFTPSLSSKQCGTLCPHVQDHTFFGLVWFLHHASDTQKLLPGVLRRPSGDPGIKPEVAICKANTQLLYCDSGLLRLYFQQYFRDFCWGGVCRLEHTQRYSEGTPNSVLWVSSWGCLEYSMWSQDSNKGQLRVRQDP